VGIVRGVDRGEWRHEDVEKNRRRVTARECVRASDDRADARVTKQLRQRDAGHRTFYHIR
jgi:hypothetical protein